VIHVFGRSNLKRSRSWAEFPDRPLRLIEAGLDVVADSTPKSYLRIREDPVERNAMAQRAGPRL
jgi:hypothetical protein